MSLKYLKEEAKIKKHFSRGEAFLKDKYIDNDTVYTKISEKYFYCKGLCSGSKKNKNYWASFALKKTQDHISYAYCKCPSGSSGICSHTYVLMKLFAEWCQQNKKEFPESVPCTSNACISSVHKSRQEVEKRPFSSLKIVSAKEKADKAEKDWQWRK